MGSVAVHKFTNDPTKAWDMIKIAQKHVTLSTKPPNAPVTKTSVRFVCISDTHGMTSTMPDPIPQGDVLLHAGDITKDGHPKEINEFNTFLGKQPHKYKVVIAGNHDFSLEESIFHDESRRNDWRERFDLPVDDMDKHLSEKGVKRTKDLLTNAIYLQDSETSVFGIRIYGSPWSPVSHGWVFDLARGQPCLNKWNLIPEGIDVLLTHCPPIGHGDLCTSGLRAGCVELLSTVQNRVKPKFHVFGHIHEGYGITSDGYTTYINASTTNLTYNPFNPPVVFDLPLPPGFSKD